MEYIPNILQVKDKDGNWQPIPALKGDKGDPYTHSEEFTNLANQVRQDATSASSSATSASVSASSASTSAIKATSEADRAQQIADSMEIVQVTGDSKTAVMSQKAVTDEINRPKHTVMVVSAYAHGIGYKADYNSAQIRHHRDGGGLVLLNFDAPDGTGEQSYRLETIIRDRVKGELAVFRRAWLKGRINIYIDSNANVEKVETPFDDKLSLDSDMPVQNKTITEAINRLEGQRNYPLVVPTETTLELNPNTYYKWGEVPALAVTLGAAVDEIANEYVFEFVSGSEATNLSVPTGIKWVSPLAIEQNKTYQVSILNNIGVIIRA